MNISPEGLIMIAKACDQAGRPEEMFEYMKQFIEANDCELRIQELKIFSDACLNIFGPKRFSLRVIQSLEYKQQHKENENNRLPLLLEMRKKVVEEAKCLCEQILALISTLLCKENHNAESKVFFLKMKADYYRYLFEFSTQENQPKIAQQSLQFYQEASEIASTNLHETNPARLGVALNSSVLYCEVLNDGGKGCEIAKMAFDDAIPLIDQLDEDEYRESTIILGLIRDNLTLWADFFGEDEDENQ